MATQDEPRDDTVLKAETTEVTLCFFCVYLPCLCVLVFYLCSSEQETVEVRRFGVLRSVLRGLFWPFGIVVCVITYFFFFFFLNLHPTPFSKQFFFLFVPHDVMLATLPQHVTSL